MPDYKAVLNKTISGLGSNTEEVRAKVYERARQTIRKQLDAVNPPLPAERIERETQSLEAAILEVEVQYAPPLADVPEDTPEDIFEEAAPGVDVPDELKPAASVSGDFMSELDNNSAEIGLDPKPGGDGSEGPIIPEPVAPPVTVAPPLAETPNPIVMGKAGQKKRPKRRGRLIAFLILLLAIAGGVFAYFQNRELVDARLQQYAKSLNLPIFQDDENGAVNDDGGSIEPSNEGAANTGNEDGGKSATGTDADPKFDERLGSDGQTQTPPEEPKPNEGVVETPTQTETSGEVGTAEDPNKVVVTVDENGTTFTPPTTDGTDTTAGQDAATNTDPATETNSSATPIVAQRAFFYVESSANQGTTRTTGSAVWSNGERDGLPTIEAQIELSDLNIKANFVLHKNTDQSLPATHVIELLFTVPDDFDGRAIDVVRQIVMKDAEEDQGSALIAVPAKISDGYFLFALNDIPEARTANEEILQARNWIDLPIAYTTGRRALLTLEKGGKGSSVFETAFKAWAN